MVNLERTLAEIEVLARELGEAKNLPESKENFNMLVHFGSSLSGILQDTQLVYKKYIAANQAIKKRKLVEGSSYIGEMAMDCKNLADNLNIFMQSIYGKYSGNLKAIETNTHNAPQAENGNSLYQIFAETHNHSRESIVKSCRDSKGHGKGHTLLTISSHTQSGFQIFYGDLEERKGGPDAMEFLDKQAQSYLEMTKKILQTIADKDTEHFVQRKSNREFKILKQRAKNFYQRHSKPIAIAAAATLLTAGTIGGSIGTIAYQNYEKQIEMQKILRKIDYISDVDGKFRSSYDMWELGLVEDTRRGLIEKRRLELQTFIIAHPEFVSNYNLENVFGTESNLFETVSSGLELKSAQLGIYVDNYISRASVNPTNVIGKTKEFLDRRTKFRKELQSFSEETRGKVPNYAALERLNQLFNEEKDLESIESSIVSGFPHGQLR